jgi:hypothetical protein
LVFEAIQKLPRRRFVTEYKQEAQPSEVQGFTEFLTLGEKEQNQAKGDQKRGAGKWIEAL